MPNPYYVKERKHERNIINRYIDKGMNGIRSSASKGVIDGFAWNEKMQVLVCSRDHGWTENDRNEYLQKIKPFPGCLIVFFEFTRTAEVAYVYKCQADGSVKRQS